MNIQLEVFFSFSFSYFQSGKMQVSGTIYVTQKKILRVHCFYEVKIQADPPPSPSRLDTSADPLTMGCHPMLTENANFATNALRRDLSTVNVQP